MTFSVQEKDPDILLILSKLIDNIDKALGELISIYAFTVSNGYDKKGSFSQREEFLQMQVAAEDRDRM